MALSVAVVEMTLSLERWKLCDKEPAFCESFRRSKTKECLCCCSGEHLKTFLELAFLLPHYFEPEDDNWQSPKVFPLQTCEVAIPVQGGKTCICFHRCIFSSHRMDISVDQFFCKKKVL